MPPESEPQAPSPFPLTPHEPQPTVGRIVHFHEPHVDYPRAAIVTFVWAPQEGGGPAQINATVFQPNGPPATFTSLQHESAPNARNGSRWCWPPRS